MQIDVVAPQVCNLILSNDLHRTSCRTRGLVGEWSCGLMNLHPALAFLAECTASQPWQGKLHGVCLFDHITFDRFSRLPQKGLDCRAGVSGGLR